MAGARFDQDRIRFPRTDQSGIEAVDREIRESLGSTDEFSVEVNAMNVRNESEQHRRMSESPGTDEFKLQ